MSWMTGSLLGGGARIRWRAGSNAALVYSLAIVFIGLGLAGSVTILLGITSRDLPTWITGIIFLVTGFSGTGLTVGLLSRNYVSVDIQSAVVLVVVSGVKQSLLISEVIFLIPSRPSLAPMPVRVKAADGREIRCGLMSQAKIWRSFSLRRFIRFLEKYGFEYVYI